MFSSPKFDQRFLFCYFLLRGRCKCFMPLSQKKKSHFCLNNMLLWLRSLIPNILSDLLRFKSDTQPQFGHPVLFQQFEVWTQCQAKGPSDPLHEPVVFSGVTRSCFGMIPPLQVEDLHQNIHTNVKTGHSFRWTVDISHRSSYFCPADDLPVFFVFWLLEHLRTADGLHGFPIDGTYNSVRHKHIDNL